MAIPTCADGDYSYDGRAEMSRLPMPSAAVRHRRAQRRAGWRSPAGDADRVAGIDGRSGDRSAVDRPHQSRRALFQGQAAPTRTISTSGSGMATRKARDRPGFYLAHRARDDLSRQRHAYAGSAMLWRNSARRFWQRHHCGLWQGARQGGRQRDQGRTLRDRRRHAQNRPARLRCRPRARALAAA